MVRKFLHLFGIHNWQLVSSYPFHYSENYGGYFYGYDYKGNISKIKNTYKCSLCSALKLENNYV